MIAIIDYGLGNLKAFENVYRRLNIAVTIAKTTDDLSKAGKLILPGVGAFDHAMQRLEKSGMRSTIERLVIQQGVPVLGVCVGMQILANSSEEGTLSGLGWIDGTVNSFETSKSSKKLQLPHMGWNDVRPIPDSGLFKGMEQDARFYFLHSYYFHCHDNRNVLAESNYEMTFSCAVKHKNIHGVQFHPEKSHHHGALLLKNFAEL